ncbi:hypothetical protein F350042L8_13240 [Fusobacterium ulcerans]|uniref:Uncharacterized protein n=2 Tax=Fusobacterium ulcerans TaxID=861 RepID=A0AAX2J966_9FUSO|nr:hypothetical protein HMPREF0402_02324 [Fusobacterium ulcerans 12-1B]EJZ44664.1 hypothetical protein FUAG_03248 [Fusobacterium ulcerans ATCC 49185]MDH6457437.1 hypothetical protein [Fusobacterium sp. PH5-7]SQJ00053.1 Uncharacterised protein [Fusobacterium ulcerans]
MVKNVHIGRIYRKKIKSRIKIITILVIVLGAIVLYCRYK